MSMILAVTSVPCKLSLGQLTCSAGRHAATFASVPIIHIHDARSSASRCHIGDHVPVEDHFGLFMDQFMRNFSDMEGMTV